MSSRQSDTCRGTQPSWADRIEYPTCVVKWTPSTRAPCSLQASSRRPGSRVDELADAMYLQDWGTVHNTMLRVGNSQHLPLQCLCSSHPLRRHPDVSALRV